MMRNTLLCLFNVMLIFIVMSFISCARPVHVLNYQNKTKNTLYIDTGNDSHRVLVESGKEITNYSGCPRSEDILQYCSEYIQKLVIYTEQNDTIINIIDRNELYNFYKDNKKNKHKIVVTIK